MANRKLILEYPAVITGHSRWRGGTHRQVCMPDELYRYRPRNQCDFITSKLWYAHMLNVSVKANKPTDWPPDISVFNAEYDKTYSGTDYGQSTPDGEADPEPPTA